MQSTSIRSITSDDTAVQAVTNSAGESDDVVDAAAAGATADPAAVTSAASDAQDIHDKSDDFTSGSSTSYGSEAGESLSPRTLRDPTENSQAVCTPLPWHTYERELCFKAIGACAKPCRKTLTLVCLVRHRARSQTRPSGLLSCIQIQSLLGHP